MLSARKGHGGDRDREREDAFGHGAALNHAEVRPLPLLLTQTFESQAAPGRGISRESVTDLKFSPAVGLENFTRHLFGKASLWLD